jgi:hypothetical protein
LAVARRLTAGMKIQITHEQAPTTPEGRPASEPARDVHGRLRDFIGGDVAQGRAVMSGAGV